jgi:hypothetical protein
VLAFAPAVAQQEEILFEVANTGVLELAGQSRLSIEGISGTVFVRAGKQGEVRYSAVTRAARRDAHDVALWLRGGTMIFRPVEGRESDELILEIALSEGIRLSIEKTGGKVQVASVLADVSVDAVDAEVDIRGAAEGVDVRLERGSLRLENLDGPTTIQATAVPSVVLNRLNGRTQLTLSGGSVEADSLGGVLEIDLEQSTIVVRSSGGAVRGSATGGRVALTGVLGGAVLELEEAPLQLSRCRGEFKIDTDAGVNFSALEGSLAVNGFGGAIVGDGHSGEVTVENRDAVVTLSNITGPLTLKGAALRIKLVEIGNRVTAELTDSEIVAEKVRGGVDVTNDFGDVSVVGVEGSTKIVNRNGSVVARNLSGTVEIDAQGPEVQVGWREIGRDRDSRIENRGGDLFVDFPPGGGGRVEAEADSIETDLEGMQVEEGGQRAQGIVGNVDKPTVQLKASGRLVLSRGAGSQ